MPEDYALAHALTDGVLERTPWPFAYLPAALPAEFARRLATDFRLFSLRRRFRSDGDKTYHFRTARLDPGALPASAPWQSLVATVTSAVYRDAMGTMTGLDLTGHDLGLDLWEYEPGDWLSPHVDKPEKLVTQLLYLTEDWRPEHGGYLRVLRDAAPGSVDRLLAPALGSSTVLVRSGSSWHAVDSPRPGSPVRRSLTITFSHRVG